MDANNLLKRNLRVVKMLLSGIKVASTKVSSLGDIEIAFENGIVIQIIIDAQYNGEFYRILDRGNHYIVGYENGNIVFEKIAGEITDGFYDC